MNNKQIQPWLHTPFVDSVFILAPAFIASLLALLFRDTFNRWDEIPPWAWLSLVLCVDVAHVYATLFRTYWHPSGYKKHRTLLLSAPLLVWITGTLLYVTDAMLFWRVLAYLAVFHFIRQQYGFVRLYSRGELQQDFLGIPSARIDQFLVYATTLFPVICWHTQLPRRFHWFIDGDFISGTPELIAISSGFVYLVAIFLFVAKEIQQWRTNRRFNWPKSGVIAGTACSWFIGIVAFDNDMAFTLTNVVSHGVPYMALVWIYNQRDRMKQQTEAASSLQTISWMPVTFLASLLLLAFVEEGLWDGLVWREHSGIFSLFQSLPAIHQHALLALLVPLLTVPQATHYLLDGFIWKTRTD